MSCFCFFLAEDFILYLVLHVVVRVVVSQF